MTFIFNLHESKCYTFREKISNMMFQVLWMDVLSARVQLRSATRVTPSTAYDNHKLVRSNPGFSKLEYAAPAFSTSLPRNLKEKIDKIEVVQRRAMNIIYPNLTYSEAMKYAKINTLNERRLNICKTFFNSIQDSKIVLNHLLPEKRNQSYSLRTERKFPILHCNTSG